MPKKVKKNIVSMTCPHCNKTIKLDEALTHPIEEELKKKFESDLKSNEKKYDLKTKKVEKELQKKNEKIKKLEKSVSEQIQEALNSKSNELKKEAEEKAQKSLNIKLKGLEAEVKEKRELLDEAEKKELEFIKDKRKFEEDKKRLELDVQRKIEEEKGKLFEDAVKKVTEEHELKDKDKQKEMDDLKKKIEELKQKSEQGSQKLQGEILELELENVLSDTFTEDQIEPISSGTQGADILQKVCKNGKVCGSILIESKRTKNWSNGWISKLKEDQRELKAEIAVLATTTLPNGIENFELRKGVIVIHYRMIIPITSILRNQLIEIAKTKNLNSAMDEKIGSLYTYLTGTEFKQRVESIVEAFVNMADDLQKEKRAMIKIWSKREKQMGQALKGIGNMYGGMQGILGSSMPEIRQLEMSDIIEDDNEEDEEKIEALNSKKAKKHYINKEIEEMEKGKDFSNSEKTDNLGDSNSDDGIDMFTGNCVVCGKEFQSVSKSKKYCSYDCRNEAARKRRK